MNKWQLLDPSNNLTFPYYTHEFLDILQTWDITEWKVFEYGGGDSSLWWRDKVKQCISVDTNEKWANDRQLILEQNKEKFINYPINNINETNELFDCIIIDGEPLDWRDLCTNVALQCIKPGGVLIIDNWCQNSIKGLGTDGWKESMKLLSKYKGESFKHRNHYDWTTAYWIIN